MLILFLVSRYLVRHKLYVVTNRFVVYFEIFEKKVQEIFSLHVYQSKINKCRILQTIYSIYLYKEE